MPVASPKSIVSEVYNQLSRSILDQKRYLDVNDEQYRAWEREIDKLLFKQTGSAHLCYALLAQLAGDVEAAELHLERARKHGESASLVNENVLLVYSNLVCATKFLSAAESSVSVPANNVARYLHPMMASGGFAMLRKLLQQTESAGVDMTGHEHVATLRSLVSVVPVDVTDAQYAAAIDTAGDVLRKHRLFWYGSEMRISHDEATGCAGIRYRVGVSTNAAAEMNLELVDLLIDRNLIDVPLTLGFIGVGE